MARLKIIVLCLLIGQASLLLAQARATYTELLLTVTLNGQPLHGIISFLYNKQGGLLISSDVLKTWRLENDHATVITYHQKKYYVLNSFKGLHYQLDMTNLAVDIEAPSQLFAQSRYNLLRTQPLAQFPKHFGIYVNYDLLAQRVAQQNTYNGVFTSHVFNRLGTGSFGFLLNKSPQHFQAKRLNTTWTIDYPAERRSLRLGDNLSDPGLWGNSVSFGGIQWASNFSTQPNFDTVPLPAARGEAVVPSTIDVYVNNALVASRQVPVGPFDIQAIPAVNGQGDISLVTTDILGRQHTVEIPYYMADELLKPGLHNYSFSLGFIRENFGIESNDYGRMLFSGSDTFGITNQLTGQWHAELLRQQQTLGVGSIFLVPNVGLLTVAVAGSHAKRGMGSLLLLRYQRQQKNFSYGVTNQFTSHDFIDVGLDEQNFAPAMQNQFFFGYTLPNNFGSIGTTLTNQVNRGSENTHFLSMNYNTNIARDVFFSLDGLTNIGGVESKSVFANIIFNIDDSTSLSVGSTLQQDANGATVNLQRSLPVGPGFGYSLFSQSGQTDELQANAELQTEHGLYSAQLDRQDKQNNYQFGAQGSMVYFAGDTFLTHDINDSFAVVRIPGYKNIGVYQDNELVAHTDAKGNALLPDLASYQTDPVSLNVADLPLNTNVSTLRKSVTPYYHSGALVKFNITPSKAALVTLILPNKHFLPVGATVRIVGQNKVFPVGYNGEVYLTGLQADNVINATFKQTQCYVKLKFPQTNNPLPNLGIKTCRRMKT